MNNTFFFLLVIHGETEEQKNMVMPFNMHFLLNKLVLYRKSHHNMNHLSNQFVNQKSNQR